MKHPWLGCWQAGGISLAFAWTSPSAWVKSPWLWGAAVRWVWEKQTMCMASPNKGQRCKRRRTHGSFCAHHYDLASSTKWSMTLFDSVKEPARHAMKTWEQCQVDLALQMSEAENKELQDRMRESYQLVDARLELMHLRRVPVAALGNCQFDALVYSAQVLMTSMELRCFIAQYLRPLARFFQERMEGQFKGRFESYCANLQKEGVWGDELSLLGAAHILQRPIVLVTDSKSNKPEEYCRQINPPALIDESLWGPKVVFATILDKHFDATEPSSWDKRKSVGSLWFSGGQKRS